METEHVTVEVRFDRLKAIIKILKTQRNPSIQYNRNKLDMAEEAITILIDKMHSVGSELEFLIEHIDHPGNH